MGFTKCIVCGKEYEMCRSCDPSVMFSWKLMTDTTEHFGIYMVLKDYNDGIITIDKAKELLEQYDLSEKDTFIDDVRKCIDKILDSKSAVNTATVSTEKKSVITNKLNRK